VWSPSLSGGVVSEDYRFMTYNSRKTVPQQLSGLGFVILLHIIVIYIVASGLGHQAVEKIMGPIETRVIEEAKKQTEEPPPPPPKIETPPPFVPPPDMEIAAEPTPDTTAIRAVQSTKPVAAPTPQPAPTAEVAPRNDPRRPNTIPESAYPPQSRRSGEEGEVILNVLVLETGKVGEVKIEKSSGFERLDEAAVNYVQRNWRYLPGTRDGKPVSMWKAVKVTWKVKKV
jgi:periplasmic protein TonB